MSRISFMEDRAAYKWDEAHPIGWPSPPRKMPRWFNLRGRIALRDMEEVFGHIEQASLDRFWAERAKGQSVHEDAGGYLIRCYAALMGDQTEDPYTYSQANADLLQAGGRR